MQTNGILVILELVDRGSGWENQTHAHKKVCNDNLILKYYQSYVELIAVGASDHFFFSDRSSLKSSHRGIKNAPQIGERL